RPFVEPLCMEPEAARLHLREMDRVLGDVEQGWAAASEPAHGRDGMASWPARPSAYEFWAGQSGVEDPNKSRHRRACPGDPRTFKLHWRDYRRATPHRIARDGSTRRRYRRLHDEQPQAWDALRGRDEPVDRSRRRAPRGHDQGLHPAVRLEDA